MLIFFQNYNNLGKNFVKKTPITTTNMNCLVLIATLLVAGTYGLPLNDETPPVGLNTNSKWPHGSNCAIVIHLRVRFFMPTILVNLINRISFLATLFVLISFRRVILNELKIILLEVYIHQSFNVNKILTRIVVAIMEHRAKSEPWGEVNWNSSVCT